jgi:hypothetical protein
MEWSKNHLTLLSLAAHAQRAPNFLTHDHHALNAFKPMSSMLLMVLGACSAYNYFKIKLHDKTIEFTVGPHFY